MEPPVGNGTPTDGSSIREKRMLFVSALTKQLCASAVLATLASTMFVSGLAAETTDAPPAETKAAEGKTVEPAKKEETKKPATEKKKSTVTVGGLEWRTDYNKAYQAAKR